MQILLNFETGNLIIQEIAKETNNIQYAEKEITYIPEQICKMKFSWYNNTLKVSDFTNFNFYLIDILVITFDCN